MKLSLLGALLGLLVLCGFAALDAVRLQPVFNAGGEDDAASEARGEELQRASSHRRIRNPHNGSTRIALARMVAVFSAEPSRFILTQFALIDPHDSLRALRI